MWCTIDVGYYIKPNGVTMEVIVQGIEGGPPESLVRSSIGPFSKSRSTIRKKSIHGYWHSMWCAIDVEYYIKPNGITMAYIFLYIKGGPPGSLLRGSVWPFSKSRTAKKTLARCPEKNILWNYICWSALYMIWRKTVIFLHWLFGGNSTKWGFLCPPSLY